MYAVYVHAVHVLSASGKHVMMSEHASYRSTMHKTVEQSSLQKLLWALISHSCCRSIWACLLKVRVTKQMKRTFMVMHIGVAA